MGIPCHAKGRADLRALTLSSRPPHAVKEDGMRRNIVFASATAVILGVTETVGAANEDQLTHASARAALE